MSSVPKKGKRFLPQVKTVAFALTIFHPNVSNKASVTADALMRTITRRVARVVVLVAVVPGKTTPYQFINMQGDLKQRNGLYRVVSLKYKVALMTRKTES